LERQLAPLIASCLLAIAARNVSISRSASTTNTWTDRLTGLNGAGHDLEINLDFDRSSVRLETIARIDPRWATG